ncbi:hypothetical protein UPYG_G00254360 [Umbra pygmaea]|uniref:5'-nucleotidase n=1 Tax=Umbra pygmaea TaxID=75934 RepID=A0ABD0WY75_UMBPY
MMVNAELRQLYPDSDELFEIVLMTNNDAKVGVRLLNSINHYELTTDKFCMMGGQSPIGFLKAYMTNLYLSEDEEKVTEAISQGIACGRCLARRGDSSLITCCNGIAAATMFTAGNVENQLSDTQLRVAFDGDGVLFSDESQIVFNNHGLDSFHENEERLKNQPLQQGLLKYFLEALVKLQNKFDKSQMCPIKTYLVTSRSEVEAGARVHKTLQSWGLKIDQFMFLAGKPKGPPLQKIQPHIFFEDDMKHINLVRELGIITAHVPYGINNM